MAGSEKKHRDGWKLYTAREYKGEKLTEILQPKGKRCINHDNTLRRQPPLHQWRETASQGGEGSSQCCWIYYADVAWGVWGGRALASCVGSPAHFPWNRPGHAHKTTKTVAQVFDRISSLERCFRHRKSQTLPKNVELKHGPAKDNMGK